MKMFVVLALAAAVVAEPEAAADAQYISTYGAYPALVYSNAYTPYTSTYAAAAYPYSHVATPFVRTLAAPYVNTVASVVPAVASHTVTSYNNPNHYTAVSNGVYGPKYVAKNGPVQHVVKREAEADPALIYSNVAPLASTYAIASPLTTTYNHVATPLTTTYNHVATPLTTTYNNIVASPITYAAHVATPLASNGAHAVAATTAGWTHSANV